MDLFDVPAGDAAFDVSPPGFDFGGFADFGVPDPSADAARANNEVSADFGAFDAWTMEDRAIAVPVDLFEPKPVPTRDLVDVLDTPLPRTATQALRSVAPPRRVSDSSHLNPRTELTTATANIDRALNRSRDSAIIPELGEESRLTSDAFSERVNNMQHDATYDARAVLDTTCSLAAAVAEAARLLGPTASFGALFGLELTPQPHLLMLLENELRQVR
jgi:hypothetical protein